MFWWLKPCLLKASSMTDSRGTSDTFQASLEAVPKWQFFLFDYRLLHEGAHPILTCSWGLPFAPGDSTRLSLMTRVFSPNRGYGTVVTSGRRTLTHRSS